MKEYGLLDYIVAKLISRKFAVFILATIFYILNPDKVTFQDWLKVALFWVGVEGSLDLASLIISNLKNKSE